LYFDVAARANRGLSMCFLPQGFTKLVRKTTSDPKKLKVIADLLGIAEPIRSAKIEAVVDDREQSALSRRSVRKKDRL
jgi:hypothetical protein